MPARQNGRDPNTHRVVPLVEAGGEAVPLPPLTDLHADGMPGGSLHAEVSKSSNGFMTPSHVAKLEDTAQRAHENSAILREVGLAVQALDGKVGALSKAVDKPDPDIAQIKSKVTDLQSLANSIDAKIKSLDKRPTFDPSLFAVKEHDHPPHPLPAHKHTDLEKHNEELRKVLDDHLKLIDVQAKAMALLEGKLKQTEEDLKFVRDLAEKAIESKSKTQEHGRMGGGRLHDSVSDRLAGFMTPELLRRLNILWDSRQPSGE